MGLVAILDREPAQGESLLRRALAALPESEGRVEARCEPFGPALGGKWLPAAAGGLAESPRRQVVVDGLVENRAELTAVLGLPADSSSAEVALAAWERWDKQGFARLQGPFVLLAWDRIEHRLLAVRDVLGARPLVFCRRAGGIYLASDVGCLLSLPGVSDTVNETSIARLFAVEGPRPGETFFAEIEEVPAGHLLELCDGTLRVTRFDRLEPAALDPSRPDGELIEEFRELLERAVAAHLPAERFGILLSGGLDSGAITCVAAEQLRAAGSEPPVAFSFVFDQLPCDESTAMAAVVERHGLEWERVVSDDLWPLCSLMPPPGETAPLADLYGASHQVARQRARARGLGVLWSGHFGDHLYVHGNLWLRDLVRRGRWAEAFAALRGNRRLKRSGLPHRRLRGPLARIAVDLKPRARALPWITPEAALLAGEECAEPAPRGVRPGHWLAFTDTLQHLGFALPAAQAARDGIDLRFPYLHRRLVAWALAAPARLLYRPGSGKWILREAMRDIMPDPVRTRQATTTLLPLAVRGLAEKERSRIAELLSAPDAWWPRFVRRQWLDSHFPAHLLRHRDGVESFMIWTCICLEQWRRQLATAARAA